MKQLLLMVAVICLMSSVGGGIAGAQTRPQKISGTQHTQGGGMSTQDQLMLQQTMSDKSHVESAMSKTMKKNANTDKNIIQNLKR